ncbi:sigma-70 family RNA polymerase sigma factor [Pontibacillus sp. ALD_SL1]|uniref:RNA polymerase sigma factor n=1 Tax=Pontibacillus sp. ALD_SL1 TaxID=2777185 RepID=UPI001A9710FF|nr:sigma-70 family RNA polymerase sigma factor [Pontibacillus sp. ALD_SL1]QST00689.1 sigma-70 family RNA polymerase sigma factor [Pontibacillus sp. ALD_SL1]
MREVEEKFYKEFPNLKGNRAVEAFLRKPEHQELLKEYVDSPNQTRKDHLDKAFKVYYFGLRFTSYLNKSLYFQSVNYDKRMRRFAEHNTLTLDQSVGDEDGITFKDQLVSEGEILYMEAPTSLKDCIEDDLLLEAYFSLTDKQREVLDMAYLYELKDTEIAKRMDTSQQAVSKSRKKALKKLRSLLSNE